MSPIVDDLSMSDMRAVSAYYSKLPPANASVLPREKETATEKRARLVAEGLCAACHGPQGISIRDNMPNIAGQSTEYIEAQLHKFHDRTRQGYMYSSVGLLKKSEYKLLSDYYANMPGCVTANDAAIPCNLVSEGFVNEITEVGDGLYAYNHNTWVSAFLVTPEGIILTDPAMPESGAWLKQELKKRFNVPVRYVIMSHSHTDHLRGSSVFADEAIVVSHINTKKIIEKRAKGEVEAAQRAGRVVIQEEAIPDVTFTDQMTITLGGYNVELEHLSPYSHSNNDVIAVNFVEQKLLYAVDVLNAGEVGFMDFRESPFPGQLDDVRSLIKRDFNYFMYGHGPAQPRKAAQDYVDFLEAINREVRAAIAQGKTIDEAKRDIKLPEFGHMVVGILRGRDALSQQAAYESQLELNVEGAYLQIEAHLEGRTYKTLEH